MTVAAFQNSSVGSQQSREIAFQYYDKVSKAVEVSPRAAEGCRERQ